MKKSFIASIISAIVPALVISLAPVAHAADITSKAKIIGNPFAQGTYANNVWDMQVYNNKIYLGHGNSSNFGPNPNAGPISIVSLDPATKQFKSEYTTYDEQVDTFKVINGALYVPGNDSRGSWSEGNYYTLTNNTWAKYSTVTKATHVLDLAFFNGRLYTANETQSANSGEVMSLDTSTNTWISMMKNSTSKFVTVGNRANTMFEFKNKLYAASQFISEVSATDGQYNNLLVFDGTSTSVQKVTGASMIPGAPKYYFYKLIRPTTFNNTLFYITAATTNWMNWSSDGLYSSTEVGKAKRLTLPNKNAKPADIIVRNNSMYVLSYVKKSANQYTVIVYKTNDGTAWTELFSLTQDTFARSFEEVNGSFFLGLGCDTDVLSKSTGTIIEVANGSY